MAEDKQELDAGRADALDAGAADASPNTLQIVASVDAGHLRNCEQLDPLQILPAEIAAKVKLVLNCNNFKPVFVREGVKLDCELPEIAEVISQFRFKGLMIFFEDDVMDLQKGELYYEAIRNRCNEYSQSIVQVLGLELKPTGDSGKTTIQAKIEEADAGDVLVRVHFWDGSGYVEKDGQKILEMTKDMQAKIRAKDGEVLEVFSTAPQETESELTAQVNGTESGKKHKKGQIQKAETRVADGCDVSPVATGPLVDPVIGGIALLALLKALQPKSSK